MRGIAREEFAISSGEGALGNGLETSDEGFVLVLFCLLLDVTDLLCQLLQRVFVVLVLSLELWKRRSVTVTFVCS